MDYFMNSSDVTLFTGCFSNVVDVIEGEEIPNDKSINLSLPIESVSVGHTKKKLHNPAHCKR